MIQIFSCEPATSSGNFSSIVKQTSGDGVVLAFTSQLITMFRSLEKWLKHSGRWFAHFRKLIQVISLLVTHQGQQILPKSHKKWALYFKSVNLESSLLKNVGFFTRNLTHLTSTLKADPRISEKLSIRSWIRWNWIIVSLLSVLLQTAIFDSNPMPSPSEVQTRAWITGCILVWSNHNSR